MAVPDRAAGALGAVQRARGRVGLPFAQEVSTTINAVVAFVGALIGISTANYKRELGGDGDGKGK